MPSSKSITDLRDAYLRLEYIHCMNELEEDQEWIAKFLQTAKRKIGRMLKELEPERRLPSVLHDTRLGRAIKEAREDMKRYAKCKHDLQPYEDGVLTWMWLERCAKCGLVQSHEPRKSRAGSRKPKKASKSAGQKK